MTDPSILHVDMDAFFAAVEILDDPTLAGKPVIVGGAGDRGVVASCSYEARAYGIHSAMPSVQARRLCPHAVFVHGNYHRYTEVSAELHEVFSSFTPVIETISIDEAFLDVSGARKLFGTGPEVGRLIREAVRDRLRLSCSVGVATTKFVAKLASEAAKPKATRKGIEEGPGVYVVEPGTELDFLHPLPVEALWGVGPATARKLRSIGVMTVGDLAALPRDMLIGAIGSAHGAHLHDLSWARDPRRVEPVRDTKSIGHEQTYAHDMHDHDELGREAVRLADAVAGRLRAAGVAGRTVSIKVRFHDFSTITRARTLPAPCDEGPELARVARLLLDQVDPTAGVRLFGIHVSGLGEARQLSFESDQGWGPASAAVDEIRRRFGDTAVGPAAVVGESGLEIKRKGDQQWGPGEERAARVVEAPALREDGNRGPGGPDTMGG
ncbi:MAG TPA: DNA polymerase IV [Acidimicrobiales bacterium]|nr:DNA polymerase IV [Acidimicrobiales bacterium]